MSCLKLGIHIFGTHNIYTHAYKFYIKNVGYEPHYKINEFDSTASNEHIQTQGLIAQQVTRAIVGIQCLDTRKGISIASKLQTPTDNQK